MGRSRTAPGNGESSAAGDHDAAHQLTDISVAEEPAAAYSKGCTSLSDMGKKTITSSKSTSTLDDIASPHDERANVACVLQTGSRRHPGSREIQLRSIPASAAGISLVVAECRHGSEEPAPRLGQKLAEHDAILYRQNGGAEVNLASQDDNAADAQHAPPGRGPRQTRRSPLPSASDAGRHFNALQSPGPLSATLPRSDGRNGCGDDSSSNGIGCAADFARQTALRSRQPPAPPNVRPNQEGYLRYLVDRYSHAKGHGMWYLITRDFNQHYSYKMSLEALQMIRSRDRNHRQ
ncbi:hypothetical protein CKAH01_18420 [Colletotrichum kahawae]|uniref:Uncharacterized protein n=1 Tax=Colletotrichum kahawae TaxID=34407 RepID=A0AAD9Y894_COLKA|nr:hypothetical protein CKAH01_18420 [Colletotrichum kahawae]